MIAVKVLLILHSVTQTSHQIINILIPKCGTEPATFQRPISTTTCVTKDHRQQC